MWTTIPKLAEEAGKDSCRLYALARRKADPLPLRYLPGDERGGVVLESELAEWVQRNCELYAERGGGDG